ncbi:MAG: hypothetical protein VX379_11195 [Pseudomonadota bacterium]|uniref:hypothetical protein n=1 Tax=Alcanivorax sp. TaxID=1872427 RepID=UPI0025C513CF|nr:hypothetical protein [Alcanivorax sp.]MED5240131.1 hypothetical protein [Pseudomonadota bacterium]MEE3319294.1 hypothetical protein [Pseudomonadota bacterium]
MPIYIKRESDNVNIAKLAAGDWELPSQIRCLEEWLVEQEESLPPADYIADIGFSMRENALGGGAILSVRAMSIMAKLGIKLYLSEYPDD